MQYFNEAEYSFGLVCMYFYHNLNKYIVLTSMIVYFLVTKLYFNDMLSSVF